MDAIESLKSKNEEEENEEEVEELSEEMDDSDNETGTEMLEEAAVKECAENSPTECKLERSPKRQKVDAGKGSPNTDDGEANQLPAVQTNGKGSLAPVAKCGKKDAGRGGVGENKAQEEENGSPSSPLLVRSDENFE